MVVADGGGMVDGTAVGMAAGTEAGGTAVGGTAAIGIVGAGGPVMVGVGGAGVDGIPTGLGVNTPTVITEVTTATAVATANHPAPKTKPRRFNQGLRTSVSIMALSTAKSVQKPKVPSKLSRPIAV